MKERFFLQKSASTPYGWVLTDIEHGIVCEFIEGYFNSTQEFTELEDMPNVHVEELAGIAREMSMWLWKNHKDKCVIRAAIGKRLEELRKQRGLSQEDLAAVTGFKYQNIGRIERAVYSTGIDLIGLICDALNCRIEIVPNEDEASS